MRLDQITRLQELSEGLAEVVIEEADPRTWPGAGKPLDALTKDERGDRYWTKKNAAASMTLLVKVMNITATLSSGKSSATGDQESELDDELARAESQAKALLEKITQGGHVH